MLVFLPDIQVAIDRRQRHGATEFAAFPVWQRQAAGGYIGLCALVLWDSRRHLWAVFRKALALSSPLDDIHEPIGYRTAILIITGVTVLLLFFCIKAGMTLWTAGIFLVSYFSISITITRMRAELEIPVHHLWYAGATGPDTIMVNIFGTKGLGPANLTTMGLFYGFNRDYRNHPQPHQLEDVKMVKLIVAKSKSIFIATISDIPLGSFGSFLLYLIMTYRMPGTHGLHVGREAFTRLQ